MNDDQKNMQQAADAGGADFSDIESEIRERYDLLPDDIKKVVMDDAVHLSLYNIAKAQKLTFEDLGTLETETMMVLLGMTKPSDFRDELQVQLKKNDAEADAIVSAVNEQVFKPIRASLEKVYENKKEPGDFLAEADTFAVSAVPEAVNPVPQAPQPSLTSTEKNVLEKTGVILSDAPKPAAASPVVGSLPGRDDLLKSIENPPKTPMVNIVADKLANAAPVIPAVKKTDYTMPKPAAPVVPAASKTDPYREPIA